MKTGGTLLKCFVLGVVAIGRRALGGLRSSDKSGAYVVAIEEPKLSALVGKRQGCFRAELRSLSCSPRFRDR